jgi:hypothetical protein
LLTRPIDACQPHDLSRPGARFVLVNDRMPRVDANCALCCAKIDTGYVRELHTRLVYCDQVCFAGHSKMAMASLVNSARRADAAVAR